MRRFVLTIKLNYNDNPYHNWRHGVSVMHGTFMLLNTTKFGEVLPPPQSLITLNLTVTLQAMSPLEKFSLLCGALGHDVDHRGKSNDYERCSPPVKYPP